MENFSLTMLTFHKLLESETEILDEVRHAVAMLSQYDSYPTRLEVSILRQMKRNFQTWLANQVESADIWQTKHHGFL